MIFAVNVLNYFLICCPIHLKRFNTYLAIHARLFVPFGDSKCFELTIPKSLFIHFGLFNSQRLICSL